MGPSWYGMCLGLGPTPADLHHTRMSPASLITLGSIALGAHAALAQATSPEPSATTEGGVAESHTIECRLGEGIRLARNPVRETIAVEGLVAEVEAAYLTDVSGRAVVELGESGRAAQWPVPTFEVEPGRYYLSLYSAGEWRALAVEIE